MKNILIFFILVNFTINAQSYFVRGSVIDSETNSSLSFANIRVLNSSFGTAANRNGQYELKLSEGSYLLTASFIGYRSDTVLVDLKSDRNDIDFILNRVNLDMPQVTVLPGANPAIEIIEKAIRRKNERNNMLNSFRFEAYTKGLIRTEKEIDPKSNSVSIEVSGSDTAELKITGILENKSEGYFEKPDNYKEIILARKQSSNFPPTLNIFTGGRIIQNFYEDVVSFLGQDLPGPISENAINYYYFYIKNTLLLDDYKIYQIHIEPESESDPGFTGNLFIADKTFDLIKVELQLNRAANTGGIFDSVNIFQQFQMYDDSVYMPVDYRLFVKANYLNIARFGFELNTILYNYKINEEISDDIFNKAVVTVRPEADKKDSIYWLGIQSIPNTREEIEAYDRIDSISSMPRTFWDDFSFLSPDIKLANHFSVSAPISMYHFNSVEGHAIDFMLELNDAFERRLNSVINFFYGFSDKKFKKEFFAEYFLGDYRTYSISLNAFDNISILFGSSDYYNQLTSTVLALVTKYDFKDYYYTNGFRLNLSGEVFPILELSAGFNNQTYRSAKNNSDFSFFNKEKKFKENSPIFDSKINSISAGFNFDFRNFIEDGFFRRRISAGRSFLTFGGKFTYSAQENLLSDLDFRTYEMKINSSIKVLTSSSLGFNLYGMYNEGTLPLQLLYSIPGNLNATAKDNTFRTLEFNEYFGDRVVTVYFEQFWGNDLFRIVKLPLLKDSDFTFNTFLNAAYSEIGEQSMNILSRDLKIFSNPFYEIGFGIGHFLIPLRVEFSWKLNHKGDNNFRVGISTFAI